MSEAALANDLEARRAAQREFERPLVLEAGAGTGKTTTLVARVLSWTLGRGWELAAESRSAEGHQIAADVLKGVAAITFTEAAAAEMAARVAEGLAAVADGRSGDLPGFDIQLVDAEPLADYQDRARALLGHLDQLEVRTIHAFCHNRLMRHPLELGLHPDFRIDAELREIEETVRFVVERRTREAYAGEVGSPLLAAATLGIGPQELATAVLQLIQEAVPSATLDGSPFTAERLAATLRALIESISEFLDVADGRLHAVTRGPNARRVAEALERTQEQLEELDPQTAGAANELCRGLFEIWGQSTLAKHLRKWARTGGFSDSEAEALGERGERLRPLCRPLASRLRHLSELSPDRLEVCRRAVQPLVAETEQVMRARGITFFSHILLDAKRLFDEHPSVLAEERRRIKQLLVDEFQDTDVVQCAIISRLAFGGGRGESPGLFVVGDPKQSIYGWRSADLEAYETFLAKVAEHQGKRLSLVQNFRSAPVLLSEVERTVRPVMQEQAGLQPRFTGLLPSEKTADRQGFREGRWAPVESWVSWSPRVCDTGKLKTSQVEATEIEAEAVARDVSALHTDCGVAWKEFAVLFRATNRLDRFLEAFRRHGVPFVVTGDKQYFRRREIIEAAALIRLIVNPTDQVALLTYLRSPLVGVPDAALIPLWCRGLPALLADLDFNDEIAMGRVESVALEAAAELPTDVPGLDQIQGWENSMLAGIKTLALMRESIRTDPPDVFVERLRRTTLLEATEAARFLGQYRVANLERFLRRLRTSLVESDGDVQAVLRGLRRGVSEAQEAEEALPKDAAEDAVQLMTIHKAKGLEFSHVYLVQLDSENRKGEVNPTDADRRWGTLGPEEYSLFSYATLNFDGVAERRRRIVAAEQARILYVAMTRARERLVLLGNWSEPPWKAPSRSAPNLLSLLQQRAGLPDSIAALAAESVRSAGYVDAEGLRWKFPGLERPHEQKRRKERKVSLPTKASVAEASLRLTDLATRAQSRMARKLFGRAAASGSDSLAEPLMPGGADRSTAQLVGIVVHSALESWDVELAPADEWDRQRRRAETRLELELRGPALDAAMERVAEIFEKLRGGSILGRLISERDLIVARELPVLLPSSADDEGPLVGVRGIIDLILRDSESGDLLVIDYKTDEIEDASELENRALHYRPQLETYAEALRQALDLDRPPHAELWFIWPDRMWRSS